MKQDKNPLCDKLKNPPDLWIFPPDITDIRDGGIFKDKSEKAKLQRRHTKTITFDSLTNGPKLPNCRLAQPSAIHKQLLLLNSA